jgi:hypothetical protein
LIFKADYLWQQKNVALETQICNLTKKSSFNLTELYIFKSTTTTTKTTQQQLQHVSVASSHIQAIKIIIIFKSELFFATLQYL